jgi:predicted NBD/HSP70 family sugar kinase
MCAGGCGARTDGSVWCNTGCAWEAWLNDTAVTSEEAGTLASVTSALRRITKQDIPAIGTLAEFLDALRALSKRNLLAFLVNDCASAVDMFDTPPRREVLWAMWLDIRDG